MDTALYVGLAHKAALKRRMDVVAHNIANMSTTAFNKERVVFRQLLMDAPGAAATSGGKISYVQDHGIVRNLAPGTMVPSSNPLDVFINGRGYLSVKGQDGETVYTRNGRMMVDENRNLALLSGELVLDDSGQPIEFEEEDFNHTISKDGTVSSDSGEVGNIGLVQFSNEQAMKRRGSSLYETSQDPIVPENMTDLTIHNKAFESSNVNAIESMVEMIDVMRAYQNASKNDSSYEDLRKDSLKRLAQIR